MSSEINLEVGLFLCVIVAFKFVMMSFVAANSTFATADGIILFFLLPTHAIQPDLVMRSFLFIFKIRIFCLTK